MKIIACCKIVPNEEELLVLASGELSIESASLKISQYDLNAVECGKTLASQTGGSLTALSVGGNEYLSNSKIRKDILSRGADELCIVASDEYIFADSLQTAKAITQALKNIENYDLVLCGAGSSDLYNQEVGIQVGTLLDLPVVNNVTSITLIGENILEVERTLEDEVEVLEVTLPAVLSVSSEINTPSVPSMREIMKAGKKPVNELSVDDAVCAFTKTLEQVAPTQQERRQEIVEGDSEANIDALVSFLRKEGF